MTNKAWAADTLDPHFIYGMDAVISAAVGVALLLLAEPLTTLAGWTMPPGFLWTIGLLLLPWAAFNGWIAFTNRPAAAVVRGNIAGDTAWIVASLALIALHASSLHAAGFAMLAGQALAVAGVVAIKLSGMRALA